MKKIQISPSILSADFSQLGNEIKRLENGGADMISPNGHVSPSQTGKKMFAFDANIDNWYFSYCLVPNKSICAEYEFQLQTEMEPQFNELSMAGNN